MDGGRCPSCGEADHRRSSSSKCVNRKKRVRERDGAVERVYTVKRCLKAFICPLLEKRLADKLLEEIERDVLDLSELQFELSLLINFFYKNYLDTLTDESFLERYKRLNPLQFIYALKGVPLEKVKLSDNDAVLNRYASLRTNEKMFYDCKSRNFLLCNIAKRYDTVVETNINTHAFSRIKRFLRLLVFPDVDSKEIHEACFKRFYQDEPSSNERINAWFDKTGISSKSLKKNYWVFMPLMYKIQKELSASDRCKSFVLFPQFGHGASHLTYDSVCLFELLRRVDPKNVPSTWKDFNSESNGGAARYWSRYFDCTKGFGYSVQTDGVQVSVSMNGKEKKNSTNPVLKKVKLDIQPENSVVAVDPGAILPLVTCRKTNDKYSYTKLSAGRVKCETGEIQRERKRIKWTKSIDKTIRKDREKIEVDEKTCIGSKCSDYTRYTLFQLKWFSQRQEVYRKRRMRRLKFDKYTKFQKFTDSVAKEYFPRSDEIIVYGAGCKFMNRAVFRTKRKFSHNRLLNALQRMGRKVVIFDEHYTTKRCSECNENGQKSDVVVSRTPHRYVYCPICRSGTNRDKNGSRNIFINYVRSSFVGGQDYKP